MPPPNAAPGPVPPKQMDWGVYADFKPGPTGWVLLLHPAWDPGRRSFHASPAGAGSRKRFTVEANWQLFEHLDDKGTYLAHGVT